jgi:kynureninase
LEEEWWMLAAQVGDEIGGLMNAPQGSVACLQNVTTCEATVASCLDFSGRRNKVVYNDLNFPSTMYFWEAQRGRGARVVMIPGDHGIHVNTERLLDAIDEETLIVPISHVMFRSTFIQDVAAIVEKDHRVGAYVLLLDSFPSLATVPFDGQAFNVDFCTGGLLKWLCGGPGTSHRDGRAAGLTRKHATRSSKARRNRLHRHAEPATCVRRIAKAGCAGGLPAQGGG